MPSGDLIQAENRMACRRAFIKHQWMLLHVRYTVIFPKGIIICRSSPIAVNMQPAISVGAVKRWPVTRAVSGHVIKLAAIRYVSVMKRGRSHSIRVAL
jgi:hypothetical protein